MNLHTWHWLPALGMYITIYADLLLTSIWYSPTPAPPNPLTGPPGSKPRHCGQWKDYRKIIREATGIGLCVS
jgi:hypothetical protein